MSVNAKFEYAENCTVPLINGLITFSDQVYSLSVWVHASSISIKVSVTVINSSQQQQNSSAHWQKSSGYHQQITLVLLSFIRTELNSLINSYLTQGFTAFSRANRCGWQLR